jgi:hypothetical protein
MLAKLIVFVGWSVASLLIVAAVFGLNCRIGGHSTLEGLFSWWATIVLPLMAGAQAVYISTLSD